LQEHLAWLDREIASTLVASGGGAPVSPAATIAAPVAPPRPAPALAAKDPAAISAEAIMAQYQQEADSLHGSVKRGCLIYFFLALGLVALGVAALYFFRHRA